MTTILQPPKLDIDVRICEIRGCDYHVSPNGKLERRIAWNLLNYLNEHGFIVVGIWDGEEENVFTPEDPAANNKAAMELIFNLDQVSVRVAHKDSLEDWHGILLTLGNGVDILTDWNYFVDDRDGFNNVMDAFNTEDYA